MSKLFLSHSSENNADAVAIRDWLREEGWDEVFLDVDPERGIKAGERWERALHQAASRCEAVLFLVSGAWLKSRWCRNELDLARRLNKPLYGALVENIPVAELPQELTGTWQIVNLAAGQDHRTFRVLLPGSQAEKFVYFSKEGLARLRGGLVTSGIEPRFFPWPPDADPLRPPYRGLKPLEAEDAGIFFGRQGPIVETLDALRGLRDASAPRLFVILGASGAGKSSFLRAGLLPRMARDDANFLPLPVIRPERAAVTGEENGLLHALEAAFAQRGDVRTRASIRAAIEAGAPALRPLLKALLEQVSSTMLLAEGAKKPTIVLAIDQAEELVEGDGTHEGEMLLELIRDLVTQDDPAMLVLFTIRSDSYDKLETSKALEGLRQRALPLLPMPGGSYKEVIEGPAHRLERTNREISLDPLLVDKLLVDLQSSGSSDALPLLSFTMEQLFLEYGGSGKLTLADYVRFGGIKGAITAAVRRALALAERDPAIVKDASERLRLLRRGIIPLLAGIDPETGLPRRRIAKLKDIPAEAASLVLLLRDNKLLSTDRAVVHEDGRDRYETTIEPAHEALLRQWDDLRSWLEEDRVLLTAIEVVKRAAKDWFDNGCSEDWLDHTGSRLDYAERAIAREDLVPDFPPYARDYVVACRARDERDEREERERLARERAEQERRAKDAEALAAAEAKRATAAKKAADANRRMFMAAVAGLVVVAALGALAYRQWQNASSNLAAARDIFSSLVNTAEVVQRTASLDTVEALIKPVHQTIDKHSVNGDPVIELERAQTLLILAENDWEGANLPAMQQQAAAAVGYLQPLADAGDLEAMNQLARGHRLIGRAYLEEEKDAAAKGEYDKAVAALTTLLDRHKTDANAWRWWRSLADVTEDMGDLLLQHHVGEIDDAAKYYNQSYDIRVRLTKAGHNDPGFYADVAWAINKQGDLDQARGAHGVGDHKTIELNKAAERFKEARQALEDLREALYDSPFWQHRLALMDNNIGLIDVMNGDFSGAVAEYERAERVLQPVIEQDPKNIYRSSALAWTYDNKGYAMVKQVATADGDHLMQLQSARALFQQAAERRKKIHDEAPTKKQWESDLDKTEANIAATQAMIDRLSQKDREAAEGFERAVRFLKAADEKSTNMDLVARDIEYLHDAGVERGKADDGNGARSDFAQAAQMLRDYGSKLEPADLDKLQRLLADDPHLTGEN